MKRYICAGLACILLTGAVFCLIYTRKHEYNASVPVLLYSDSAQNYAVNNTESILHIEGTLQKHLFRAPTFSGRIWLDCMDDMTMVSNEHIIENNHMDCAFTVGYEDETALANVYFAALYWNEKKDQVLLIIEDNERANFTLDGFAAAGPYDAENTELWNADGLSAQKFTEVPPVYMEWELTDALYNNQKQEFVFFGLDEISGASLAEIGAEPSDTNEEAYTLYVHFTDTELAFDTVTLEAENTLQTAFRFRSLSDYRNGLAQLTAALESLPAPVGISKSLDGRICCTAENKDGKVTSLEIFTHPEQYRIEMRLALSGAVRSNSGVNDS